MQTSYLDILSSESLHSGEICKSSKSFLVHDVPKQTLFVHLPNCIHWQTLKTETETKAKKINNLYFARIQQTNKFISKV